MELVTNKFPFPHEIGPIDLIFYITQSDVSAHTARRFHVGSNELSQPPSLEDEEDIQWPEDMKHFIKLT